METPNEWPKSIAESYDPLRVLGSGGFASVVLARHKNKQESTTTTTSNNHNIPRRVAIKVVGGNSDGSGNNGAALLYARREIELLQQIRHCGIVKLFHSWERNKNDGEKDDACQSTKQQLSSPTAGVLVLEYLKGPTVESLLKHGGALSTTFGRVVIAQVMDAIAYLHYRSVVHRDIKPDNIIVTGALSSDDSIWDNDANESPLGRDEKSPEEWKQLCSKYKATIIDFGFARALTPGDMEDTTSAKESHPVKKDTGYNSIYEDDCAQQNKKKGGLSKLLHKNSHSELNDSHHSSCSAGSVSHKMKRVMSTLGNRNYAAPEIVNKVRQFSAQDKKKEKQKEKQNKNQRTSETTKTISEFVADYGLLVDSYSMGHTIRYMMTGVQPGFSVEEAIKKQQRSGMAKKVLSKFGLGKKKSTDPTNKAPRKPRYRSMDDLPGQVFLLVENLTMLSPHKRISIRKARRKVDWIRDVLSFQQANPKNAEGKETSLEFASEEQLHSLDQTRYLPLATTTPGSVVSTNSRNDMHPHDDADPAHTVKTSTGSLHEYPFDTSDSSNNSKDPIVEPIHDDAIGLCLEDDMITF